MTTADDSSVNCNIDAVLSTDLVKSINRQVEHYFGNHNLPRDKFLLSKIKESPDGWVGMDTMLKFKRLYNICSDCDVIISALSQSKSGLLEIDSVGKRIRRSVDHPIPEYSEDVRKECNSRTVYVKKFTSDPETSLDDLLKFFEQFDGVENIYKRKYVLNKVSHFKGSLFVTFCSVEQAETFLAINSIKWKDAELIKMSQTNYFKEKEATKQEKLTGSVSKESGNKPQYSIVVSEETNVGLPTGTMLQLTGLKEDTKREDIKDILKSDYDIEPKLDIAFIFFQLGDTEAKIRFRNKNAAVDLMEKVKARINKELSSTEIVVSQHDTDAASHPTEDVPNDINHKIESGILSNDTVSADIVERNDVDAVTKPMEEVSTNGSVSEATEINIPSTIIDSSTVVKEESVTIFNLKGGEVKASLISGKPEADFLRQCSTDIAAWMTKSHSQTGHKRRGGFSRGRGNKRARR